MRKNENNFNDAITVDWKLPLKRLETKWTKSTLFLLPLINVHLNQRKDILPYVNNCFIWDAEKEDFNFFTAPLYVLLQTKDYNDPLFKVTCNVFRNNGCYSYEYEVGVQDGLNLIMMVMDIPFEYNTDFICFKQGKYSKISEQVKSKYTQEIYQNDLTRVENLAFHACFKTEVLKKSLMENCNLEEEDFINLEEWCDKPEKAREFYRYKKEAK